MKFEFALPKRTARISRRVVCFIVSVTVCLISINHLHSLAIQGSSSGVASNNDSEHSNLYGYLPPSLLRQMEGIQQGYLRQSQQFTNSTSATDHGSSNSQQSSSSTTFTTTTPTRKWAYAFLMAGVNAKSLGYRGILYNVLVSAEFLRDSQAGVILMVQMANDSPSTHLLPIEEEWLRQMNVTIQYLDLPQHGVQNFYTVQLEKFKILQWYDDYSRVLFMDGDVMPFCNLDYLFELSDPLSTNSKEIETEEPLLMKNLIVAWTLEPAHGGFFMLAPKKGDYEQLEEIVHGREQQVLESGIIFDEQVGWGHAIEKRGWRATMTTRTNQYLWDWHGDFIDQGLLYYWTKYYKKDVSIAINEEVENWSSLPVDDNALDTDATNVTIYGNLTKHTHSRHIYLDRTLRNPFDAYSCVKGRDFPRERRYSQVHTGSRGESWHAPHRDFIHFTGKFKPWLPNIQKDLDLDDIVLRVRKGDTEDLDALQSPQELWYYTFWKVHTRLKMGTPRVSHYDPSVNVTAPEYWKSVASDARFTKVNIRNLDIPKLSLGGYPTYNMLKDVMTARTGRSTSHVEGWTEIENRKKSQRKYWQAKQARGTTAGRVVGRVATAQKSGRFVSP